MVLLNKLLLFAILITTLSSEDVFNNLNQRPLHPIKLRKHSAKNIQYIFAAWKLKYGKYYDDEKEQYYRLKIFSQNWKVVQKHNLQKDDNYLTYTLELNKFGDQTRQEYLTLFQSNLVNIQEVIPGLTFGCTGNITNPPNPPDQVDWTSKAVTPVNDQGLCGSSWAIAAKGAIQGLFAIKAGPLTQFSIQQLLDCSGDYGNQGCSGGFMSQAFWYIIDNGIATSKAYPIKNTTLPQKCVYTKSMKVASFARCADIPSQSFIKLQSAVIQQPTTVAIDATELQLYKSGVYNGKCGNNINQGMLLVGYGFDQATNSTYWKLKNSLGSGWGIDGYLKLFNDGLDGPGKCGIQLAASVPQSLT